MERLVLGTWQFALKNCSKEDMKRVISYALQRGIIWFDTAQVYGNGAQETILGTFPQAKVITKIPAKEKPITNGLPLEHFYTKEYIHKCYEITLKRLGRPADILLLHNWTDDWNDCKELYEWMYELKQRNMCRAIGLSLPDSYAGRVVPFPFDWIMAPLNSNADWIDRHYHEVHPDTKICVRSLFHRGSIIPDDLSARAECIHKASYADKIVIGMTREYTIEENISILEEGQRNEEYKAVGETLRCRDRRS